MTRLSDTRRLEQGLTYVRLFGVVSAVASIATTGGWPDHATERLAWITMVFFALGVMTIWGASARLGTPEDHDRLAAVAFVFDGLIICSMVWIFAWETPYVAWALVLLIPLEGAIKYGLPGALLSGALAALLFLPQSLHRTELTGETFDLSTYIFLVGLMGLTAGATGVMAENWRRQKAAFEHQALALADADRIKDRFLAITSHEFRGPLTAIIAGVDTVSKRRDRLTPEQLDKMLEMVSGQGQQLARLVDDLLITSQLQSHTLSLQPEWCDLQLTINRALEAAAPKRRDHQLEVFVQPLLCVLDPSRTGQIVRNLVENAYKYSAERARVAISAKASEHGVAIQIVDEGPGLPQDRRAELFEAFTRLHEASSTDGVGLGLYVVSQLVNAMEGHIDVESSSRGTTFCIYIRCETRPSPAPTLGLVTDDQASG